MISPVGAGASRFGLLSRVGALGVRDSHTFLEKLCESFFRAVSIGRGCRSTCKRGHDGRAPSPQIEGDRQMSRYMLIMRSTPEAEVAMQEANIDFSEGIESMGRFNEERIKAGVMLAGEGRTGPEEGFVVDFDADPPVVTD